MIAYLKGPITHLFADFCFIDVGGVGYRVFLPFSTRQQLSVGLIVTLFTSLQVREDAMLLYGFITQGEYELFIHLTGISGVGPKVALSVLSVMRPDVFRLAIIQNDLTALTKIPGIGKKTAERMILELKDKIGAGDSLLATSLSGLKTVDTDQFSEVVAALTALGYSRSESMSVLKDVDTKNFTIEELLKMALKEFAGR
jgi:Holliday junction DNA helicase RuvA